MQAALNHCLKKLSAGSSGPLWLSALFILRNTPWSGGIGTAITPALFAGRKQAAGRASRMFNELAKSRS
jgi:hypothetical protein